MAVNIEAPVAGLSTTTIRRTADGLRHVEIPVDGQVVFGMNGVVAQHYGKKEGEYTPHATTLDYIVAATGGCLMGVLSRALEARSISLGDGLSCEATGEIAKTEDEVLVI